MHHLLYVHRGDGHVWVFVVAVDLCILRNVVNHSEWCCHCCISCIPWEWECLP
jgi:hypothetical protein